MTVFYRSGKIQAVIAPAGGHENYILYAWADADGNPVSGAEVRVGPWPTEAECKVAEHQMSERKRVREAFKLT